MSAPPATARLTLSLYELRLWGPCQREYAIVAERYPDGLPLAVEALLDLAAAGVNVWWGIRALLGGARLKPVRQRYEQATGKAEAIHIAACDAAWDRFQRRAASIDDAWGAYMAERRAAQTAYIQAAAPALTDLLVWLAAHPAMARAAGVEVEP